MIKLILLFLNLRELRRVNKVLKALKNLDMDNVEPLKQSEIYLKLYKKGIKEDLKSGKFYESSRKDPTK